MAQKRITHFIDDLDGTEMAEEGGQTVSFGLDGKLYEIDLTNENADELRDVLARYVTAGRKVTTKAEAPRQRRQAAKPDVDPAEVRAWALANGIEVPARGRVPRSVIEQYQSLQDVMAEAAAMNETETENLPGTVVEESFSTTYFQEARPEVITYQ